MAPIAHMVNPRKVWRDTLHALLAVYVHRPGHRLILIEVCCVAYQKGNTQCPVLFSPRRFARTCSPSSPPPIFSPPRRAVCRPARTSTRPSTIPTNFFTAQSLDNRASDINNLLDGIANGVQVLQAANTGITSLQKLIDSAKSIANQALQTTVGYSTKSNVSTTIAGATAADLRGTTTFASATASSNVLYNGAAGGTTAATGTTTLGATIGSFASTARDGRSTAPRP